MPSRNQEVSMSQLPSVDIPRSIFNKHYSHKTSFDCGELIPFNILEVIPGSTHSFKTSAVIRLQTLLTPIMDQVYADVYHFFVPLRLLWDHYKNFLGENDNGPWTRDKVEYRIPVLNYPAPPAEGQTGGFSQGSIADHFGVPINMYLDPSLFDDHNFPSALPFRAYAMIVNEFFRSTPLQQPIVIHKDEVRRDGVQSRIYNPTESGDIPSYITDLELGGRPFIACRFHDYFSSCLPQPQASEPVSIFGGFAHPSDSSPYSSSGPFAPVITGSNYLNYVSGNTDTYDPIYFGQVSSSGVLQADKKISKLTSDGNDFIVPTASTNSIGFVPENLYASLNIPEATISTLRLSFQLQRYYEKLGTGGMRMREYLKEFFGVSNGDARMQIPEYLGGFRMPLSIHQVANTSQTADADLGDLGAMSNTSMTHDDFTMSFSEAGYLISLVVVRFDNTYSQGLNRLWSRRDLMEFYNPVFAHLSNQPVFGRELSLGLGYLLPDESTLVDPDHVFGYQEAWQDYRADTSICTGEMRPEASNSLASWHLADDYQVSPYLDEQWIQTDKTTLDRVLSVSSAFADQIFADFYISDRATLPMPMHSIPGLADHAW